VTVTTICVVMVLRLSSRGGKLVSGIGAGTVDLKNSIGFNGHGPHDVDPVKLAMKLDGNPNQVQESGKNFQKYLQVRPQNGGQPCAP